MLSQAKIDLAVLYKLHQMAEFDAGLISPEEIARHFMCKMPVRRVEIALEELQIRGDVSREYDHFHLDDGVWQVTRQGMARVDRALKVPASFIARLHASGDTWLETEEAQKAVLKSLDPRDDPDPHKAAADLNVPKPLANAPQRDSLSIDWGKWGAIAAWLGIPIAIFAIAVTAWLDKN